jgi:hypothetical protein
MKAIKHLFLFMVRSLINRGLPVAGCIAATLAVLVCTCLPVMAAQTPAAGEYQVKAAFIFNFLRFVEWPPAALKQSGSTLSVCVLGDNVFETALDAYRGEVVGGRTVVIAYPRTLSEAERCHVLFVSPSERRRAYQVMKAMEGRSILTVSDIGNFTDLGGIIGFYMEQGYVRFDINLALARKADLKIGSQLLRHARVRER